MKNIVKILGATAACTVLMGCSNVYAEISINNKEINNPSSTTEGWKGDYIYLGNYFQDNNDTNKSPLKWKVIDKEGPSNTFAVGSAKDSIFLMTDKIVDVLNFTEDRMEKNCWDTSNLRAWLNSRTFGGTYTHGGFFNTAFNNAERNYIKTSTIQDDALARDEKVFILSEEDMKNTKYGLNLKEARGAKSTSYAKEFRNMTEERYWTRTPYWQTEEGLVYENGNYGWGIIDSAHGVAPVVNLDLDSVVFASSIENGKEDALVAGGKLEKQSENSTNEWKVTFAKSGVSVKVEPAVINGCEVTLKYKEATTAPNAYISAIVTNQAGDKVISYGKLADISAVDNGTVKFSLPDNFHKDNLKLKVFYEEYNGKYNADYAGNFVDVTFRDVVNVTGFSSGEGKIIVSEKVTTGETVKLKVETTKGYKVKNIRILKAADKMDVIKEVNYKDYTFKMPAYDVAIDATFEKELDVNPDTSAGINAGSVLSLIASVGYLVIKKIKK